jgi:hypothetical protein
MHLLQTGGLFLWKVMPFGVKNGPPTYHKVVTKTFKKYLDSFMKIFLDDFIIYSDMESHLQKFKLCFQKCKKYGINLNLNKFAFMVFSRMILGFIVPKEGKLLYPKKVQSIVNMPPLRIHNRFKYSMGWYSFTNVLSKPLLLLTRSEAP